MIYEAREPIVIQLERNVMDLTVVAPAGSEVTTEALPEAKMEVPAAGRLECQIPLAAVQDGLVPLRLALRQGRVKVQLGVARGKKLYDKRQALAEREAQRDIERAVRGRG